MSKKYVKQHIVPKRYLDRFAFNANGKNIIGTRLVINNKIKLFENITSTRQFIINNDYLGSVRIDIHSKDEKPTMETLYAAVFYVLGKIAESISNIEETYSGTKEFHARNVRDVFRNKTVNYT